MNYAEIAAGLPVIASLVLIEGLLSVDNVLGIAALAGELPEADQKKAIRLGMIGAYAFRVVALLAVSWLSGNTWLRWFAAGYLIYLMCSHLTKQEKDEADDGAPKLKPSYGVALAQIALMDLSLSIDNVIAAVALAPMGPDGHKMMWPIYVGVLLAILALLTITPYAVKLLEKFPVLEPTAFILIGFVGFLLMGEEITHAHVASAVKFVCLIGIVAMALTYARSPILRAVLKPLFAAAQLPMRGVALMGSGIGFIVMVIPNLLKTRTAQDDGSA
jgi:YkoY family integral membrane protein